MGVMGLKSLFFLASVYRRPDSCRSDQDKVDGPRLYNLRLIKDIVMSCLSIMFYIVDITTDIALAVRYYNNGDIGWFALTTAFIGISHLLVCLVCIFYRKKSYMLEIFMIPFMLGPVFSHAHFILHKVRTGRWGKRVEDMSAYIKTKITTLQLIESLMEAGPQCVLQSYIAIVSKNPENIEEVIERTFCILSSFVSITWNLFCRDQLMFTRRNSVIKEEKTHMPVQGTIAVLCWRSCECTQRTAAFALIITFTNYRCYFASAILVHVLVLMYLDFCRKSNSLSCREFLGSIFDSVLKIFCYLTTRVHIQRHEILMYYVLFHLEVSLCIGIWLRQSSSRFEPLYLPLIIGFMSCVIVQTVCQIFLYSKIEPKIDIGSIVELQHIGSGYITRRILSNDRDRL